MTATSSTATTDPLASLPPATADAVRRELRAGERVVYAGVPLTMYDAGDLRARFIGFLVPFALLWLVGVVIAMIFSFIVDSNDFVPGLLGQAGALIGLEALLAHDWLTMRDARRKAARSACVVTERRAILLATWPSRSVLSIEARDITEVFCWIVSPKCGHVRFQGGVQSTEANSLMYVPNPRACEAAMRALRDSSPSPARDGRS